MALAVAMGLAVGATVLHGSVPSPRVAPEPLTGLAWSKILPQKLAWGVFWSLRTAEPPRRTTVFRSMAFAPLS